MNSFAVLKPWWNVALGFVYPEVCQACRHESADAAQGYICAACWRKVRFIRAPFCERCGLPFSGAITTTFTCNNCKETNLRFRYARSAVSASGLVLDVIHRYKYRRELWFEPFLADLLVREAKPVLSRDQCDLIVPVPLHKKKMREREFNQAERLAARLSLATGIPLNTNLVQRVKSTQTQTLLTRRLRAKNVRRAFAKQPGAKLNGERVALVDDVFTTGATTSSCAKVLLALGASDVCVWTVARGL